MDSLLFMVNIISIAFLCYWAIKEEGDDE